MKKFLSTTLFLFGIAAAFPAMAQARKGEPGGPPSDNPAEVQKHMTELRGKVLRNRVGLTEERARKAEQILARFDSEQAKVRQNLRAARQELHRLIESESNDQKAYEQALQKLQASQKALQDLHDKQFDALKQELTAKERAKLLDALDKMRNRMQHKGERGERGERHRKPAGAP